MRASLRLLLLALISLLDCESSYNNDLATIREGQDTLSAPVAPLWLRWDRYKHKSSGRWYCHVSYLRTLADCTFPRKHTKDDVLRVCHAILSRVQKEDVQAFTPAERRDFVAGRDTQPVSLSVQSLVFYDKAGRASQPEWLKSHMVEFGFGNAKKPNAISLSISLDVSSSYCLDETKRADIEAEVIERMQRSLGFISNKPFGALTTECGNAPNYQIMSDQLNCAARPDK